MLLVKQNHVFIHFMVSGKKKCAVIHVCLKFAAFICSIRKIFLNRMVLINTVGKLFYVEVGVGKRYYKKVTVGQD